MLELVRIPVSVWGVMAGHAHRSCPIAVDKKLAAQHVLQFSPLPRTCDATHFTPHGAYLRGRRRQ